MKKKLRPIRSVSYKALVEADACTKQLWLFGRTFGHTEAVRITEKRCRDNAQLFDFWWAGTTLFQGKQRAKFAQLAKDVLAEYFAARGKANDRYSSCYTDQFARYIAEVDKARHARIEGYALAFWQASKVNP